MLVRLHAGFAAQGHNVADPLALLRNSALAVVVARGGGIAGATGAAVGRGRVTGAGTIAAVSVDLSLQVVKLGLFLRRQVAASSAGAADNSLLTGDHFLNGHFYLPPNLFLFLLTWICRSYVVIAKDRGAPSWPSDLPTPTVASAGTETMDTSSGVHLRAIWQGPV